MKLIKSIQNLTWSEKLLLLESVYHLARARILIKTRDFKRLCQVLGTQPENLGVGPTDPKAVAIGRLIERVSPHLPWNCQCLTMAIAGYSMLKRRHLPATIFIGVSKETENPELFSHAWLKSGDRCLTGARGHEQFKVILTLGGS